MLILDLCTAELPPPSPTSLPTASTAPPINSTAGKPSTSPNNGSHGNGTTQIPSITPDGGPPYELNCSNATSFPDSLICAKQPSSELNCSNPTNPLDILRCANLTSSELNCSNPTSPLDILRCNENITLPDLSPPCFRCHKGLTVANLFDEVSN